MAASWWEAVAVAAAGGNSATVVSICVFTAVLCLCLVAGHLLEENKWVNESITALIIVKKKQFFHNFMTIMSFGVFGVFISVAIVSAALGAIFSSTDTVCTLQVINQDETPRLYSLVFGEGVVNDATAVVLFNAIKNLDISRLKGRVGLCTAFVLKALYFGRHSTDREVALMALMAYLSYMLAELLKLSGILTVFFCGIVMSHYAWHNVTESSRITTRHIFATLSFIAETFIFLYVGMDALDIDKWKTSEASFKTSISIFGIVLLVMLLGRAAFVFPISILSNKMSGSSERMPITFKHQIVIWWAGLMRGAVSIALAYNQFTFSGVTSDPVHATLITCTIIVVFFTTLVFGFLTRPLISTMIPPRRAARTLSTGSNSPKDDFTLPFLSTEDDASGSGIILEQAKRSISMLMERPVHTVHIYWRKFDDKFMRPIFGGPRSH
ncbi:hypothetical protein PR202_gb17092 [Eleusine coracana subsp. coracana]|uniref:Cation/H+ exchanger transmembrane domain-containing protein n=1 Tax=Eleusine coracana subsp. coracana TaxID=191504 RepID=A0AAV5EZS9_ELECO|nr:hypothetical protein PR202_gb17092 [Eleusine coracana subsp. coracana]